MSLIISEIPKLLEPPKVEQYDTEDSKDFGKESVMAFPNLISVEIPSEKHLIVSKKRESMDFISFLQNK